MQVFTVFLALECKGKLLHHHGISQVRHQLFLSPVAMVPDGSNVSGIKANENKTNQTKITVAEEIFKINLRIKTAHRHGVQ